MRPEHQESERDDVGEPALDAAAEQRPPVELAEFFADADDQSADDGARDRGEPAEDQHRQGFQRDDLQREGDLRARAPHDAGRERDDAGGEPHDHPDLIERDADRERRLVAVGDRAQRPSDPGLLEEHGEDRDHQRGDDRRGDVELLQRHEAAQRLELDGAGRQIELASDHDLRIAAEHQLAEPDEKIGDAERRHEQDDVGLIDQRPQHQALDCDRQHQHDHHGERQRQERRHAALVEADERQRREHHHDALREIEHARGLEDQHEAERDERIEHAADQALPQRLHQEIRRRAHLHERIEKDLVEQIHHRTPYTGADIDGRRAARAGSLSPLGRRMG